MEQNPERRKDTYYAGTGEFQKKHRTEIKKILWNERMKAEAKRDAESRKALSSIENYRRIPSR